MALRLACVLVLLAGCDQVFGLDRRDPVVDAPIDARIDAPVLPPFGPAIALSELNSGYLEDDPTLTEDLLELFYDSNRPSGTRVGIWTARRTTTSEPFGAPTLVIELAAPTMSGDETTPEVALDGLTIFWSSDRLVPGDRDIWTSTRFDRESPWSAPSRVVELSSVGRYDDSPVLLADGVTIYFASARAGSNDVYRATRAAQDQLFDPPVPVPGLSDPSRDEDEPWVSSDELTAYFSSKGVGTSDEILVTTRESVEDAFPSPIVLPVLTTATEDEHDAWLSLDQRTIVFVSEVLGSDDLYIATR